MEHAPEEYPLCAYNEGVINQHDSFSLCLQAEDSRSLAASYDHIRQETQAKQQLSASCLRLLRRISLTSSCPSPQPTDPETMHQLLLEVAEENKAAHPNAKEDYLRECKNAGALVDEN